jgi:hypothetical protein
MRYLIGLGLDTTSRSWRVHNVPGRLKSLEHTLDLLRFRRGNNGQKTKDSGVNMGEQVTSGLANLRVRRARHVRNPSQNNREEGNRQGNQVSVVSYKQK